MVADQDEEEDKVRWRVEAEVRLASEDMRARLATQQQADPGAGESGGQGAARSWICSGQHCGCAEQQQQESSKSGFLCANLCWMSSASPPLHTKWCGVGSAPRKNRIVGGSTRQVRILLHTSGVRHPCSRVVCPLLVLPVVVMRLLSGSSRQAWGQCARASSVVLAAVAPWEVC